MSIHQYHQQQNIKLHHHTYLIHVDVYQEHSPFVTTLLVCLLTAEKIAVDKVGCVKYCMSNFAGQFSVVACGTYSPVL